MEHQTIAFPEATLAANHTRGEDCVCHEGICPRQHGFDVRGISAVRPSCGLRRLDLHDPTHLHPEVSDEASPFTIVRC